MPTITLLFASLHVLLMLALSVPIARHRHAHKIGLGDGGDGSLMRKIRAHGNFIEYAPFGLLMLGLLELCGLPGTWLWVLGATLLLGRLLHAAGLSRRSGHSFGRFWGTLLTWLSFLLMAACGFWLALR
ncbi:MAG: MAPEG family protein [Pseudomonadota bacterium]